MGKAEMQNSRSKEDLDKGDQGRGQVHKYLDLVDQTIGFEGPVRRKANRSPAWPYHGSASQIHRASEDHELERPPVTEEIASRLDVSIRAVVTEIDSSQEIQSLDEPLGTGDEGEFMLVDVLEDTEVEEPLELVEQTMEKQDISQSLHELKPQSSRSFRDTMAWMAIPREIWRKLAESYT